MGASTKSHPLLIADVENQTEVTIIPLQTTSFLLKNEYNPLLILGLYYIVQRKISNLIITSTYYCFFGIFVKSSIKTIVVHSHTQIVFAN